MVYGGEFYRRYQEGSSNLNDDSAKALLEGAGPIARSIHGILRFPTDLPTLILGAAGSGKCAQLGAMQLVHPSTDNFFILDMDAQYMSQGWHYNLPMGRKVYAINAQGAGLYPTINHHLHLFSILKDDDALFDNARAIAEMALKSPRDAGKNAWVIEDAKRWLTRILTSTVRLEKRVTPKRMWEIINLILTDDEFLKQWGRSCEGFPNEELSTFLEIYQKKLNATGESFSAPMSKLQSDLDWLSSPRIAESISGTDTFLEKLGDPNEKIGIYLAIKGGTAPEMQSFIRLVVGIAQLNCVRANLGALPLFYLEECAAFGNANFIKKAASEYRKFFRTVFVYQSLGQMALHMGEHGAQELRESCAYQIVLGGGIGSIKSAKEIAESVGKTTIEIDVEMEQADRAFRAETAMQQAYWNDVDLVEASRNYAHEISQSTMSRKAGRYAIDPAELMRLKNEVLILAPGKGIQPVLAQKLPQYWNNAAMAGRYAPDPLFPPLTHVKIKRKYYKGHATHKFVREPVPEHLADWPNHINGEITYVKGYRTF